MRKTKSPILEAVPETAQELHATGVMDRVTSADVPNTGMCNLDLQRWCPELRRALMKVRPEFFGWPAAEQEQYGVNIPYEDQARLEHALFNDLFGRKIRSPKVAAQAVKRLSLDQQNVWNEAILPLVGIGEDSFYLNTWFAEGGSILDFDTLRAYDEDDYRFQEEAWKKEDLDYAGRPYRGAFYLTWARLFVDARFTYATLSMAAGYIHAQLTEASRDLIEACIPHRFVPGERHGKTEGKHWQWDMRVEAVNGQEALLEELQHRVFAYESARYDALRSAWDQAGKQGVYLLDTSDPPERNLHVVLTDKEALAVVRFRSFLRDCRSIQRSEAELHQAITEEEAKLGEFIHAQHEDLRHNFDPTVTRLRKRRRIMIHQDAFDDLPPDVDDKA